MSLDAGGNMSAAMYVVKRSGQRQDVSFDRITNRIKKLAYGLSELCDPVRVAQTVTAGVYAGVSTTELDTLAAETAAALTATHPDYALLAARIAVSNLHKCTVKSFSETMKQLHAYTRPFRSDGEQRHHAPLISEETWEVIHENADVLDGAIIHDRDYDYDFFGFKTLERSYLLRIDGAVVERPQHMLMRVAVGIHGADIPNVLKTYSLLSERWFTHATPTLFNAGTPRPQLSSCFLLTMKEDSIDGIYDTLKQCASISKVRAAASAMSSLRSLDHLRDAGLEPWQAAGGIGLAVHNIRATNSYIAGTNGMSNGIIPMLRVFNDTARYVDQVRAGCSLTASPHRTCIGAPLKVWFKGGRVRANEVSEQTALTGRRQAQGWVRHLPGALARGHL